MFYVAYFHDNTLYKITRGIASPEEAKKSLAIHQRGDKTVMFIVYE